MGLQIMGLSLLLLVALQEWLNVGGLGLMLILPSQRLILIGRGLILGDLLLILDLLLLSLPVNVDIELLPRQVCRVPGLEDRNGLEQGVLRS